MSRFACLGSCLLTAPGRWFQTLLATQTAAGYASDRRNRLAEDWEVLAGAESLHVSDLPRGGLCADVAVLGANAAGMDVVDLDVYSAEARIAALRPELRAFRAWVMQRLAVAPPAPWAARGAHGRALTLTLVDRGRAAKRRLADQAAVAAAAAAAGFAVRVVDFEPLRLAEQLAALRATDVLLAVHGGALPLVMFLPPGAVHPRAPNPTFTLISNPNPAPDQRLVVVGIAASLGYYK